MLSRLKRLVYWPVGCVALAMAAFVSGCGGGGPLESDLVFSGDVSSGNLKPKDYPIHGIDVSKFQGDIDWNAVANSGVKFAWIKATEGGDPDARFQANWEGAKAAGIPHGAYHFIYWCRPPLEEINIFEQMRRSMTTRSRRCLTLRRRRLHRPAAAMSARMRPSPTCRSCCRRWNAITASGRLSIRPSISTRRISPTAR